MNDKEFNKGIENLKNISLSNNEKKAMLSNISTYADFHAPKSIQPKAQIWSFFGARSSFAVSAFGLILVVSTTAYGAEKALPGDLLYPFKVNVSESIKSALLRDPIAKEKWETEKFIRRVEEAESLAKLGKLDDASLLEVESRIDKHFEKLSNISRGSSANKISTTEDVSASRAVNTAPEATTMMLSSFAVTDSASTTMERDEFELEIEKHRAILQSIKSDNNELNERLDKLDRKLSEKVQKRAEKKLEIVESPVDEPEKIIEDTPEIEKSTDDSSDDGASVFDSQKGRGKNKNR